MTTTIKASRPKERPLSLRLEIALAQILLIPAPPAPPKLQTPRKH